MSISRDHRRKEKQKKEKKKMQEEIHRKKQNEEQMELTDITAAFVAGIILITVIVRDIWQIFASIPRWVVLFTTLFILIGTAVVLNSKQFHAVVKRHKKRFSTFGSFMTIASIFIYMLENFLLRYRPNDDYHSIIAFISISLMIIGLGIYSFIAKYKS